MSAFGIVGQMFAPIPKELPITSSITPTSTLDPAAAQYLAQHVARVKLKAAEDSYKWQSQNKILSKKNQHLSTQVEKLERIVRENSLQWRLRERDDWKNLVSAVQKDRDRLEHENGRLTSSNNSLKRQLEANNIEPQDNLITTTSSQEKESPNRSNSSSSNTSNTSNTSSTSSSPNTISVSSTNNIPHPDSANIPQATMMRFKELEAQLAESLLREDKLRSRLNTSDSELIKWKVERQADLLSMISALQQKLNLELEQKWARNRGYR